MRPARLMMQTSAVTFGETRLAYTIRRSARRRKTVAIAVGPDGDVQLVAPVRLSLARLDDIVRRKAPWILRRRHELLANGPPAAPREFVSGESLLYLGRAYRLRVHADAAAPAPAKLQGGWLHVAAPAGPHQAVAVRTALIAWLRERAAARLPERVAHWQPRAGVRAPRVLIADQRARWGSCDARGTIRLTWRLIQAPMRLVDYVVVHELIHLRHHGHGRDYWQAVGRVMPDYDRRRADLRRLGERLAW